MTKLHYVGFNGYQQCPQNQSRFSKVIANWTCITDKELLNICCSHRLVVFETKQYFKVFGVLSENPKDNLKFFKKPGSFDSFACCDEFLLASVFVDIEEETNVRVMDVACGTRHTVAKLENGNIYATGWNAYSQLGVESTSEKISKFTKSSFPKSENVKLFCGPWYTIIMEESPE